MTTSTPAPFSAEGWLKMTDAERDQLVEPFYADYLAVRAELDSAGMFPYNASFKGRIPGIDPATTGTTEGDEDTAIYLLQRRHHREADAAKRDAFLASGGMSVHLFNTDAFPLRGTIARHGWYMGGTGWQEIPDVRLVRHPVRKDAFAFIPKGKRTPREFDGGTLYFRAEGKR